MTWRKSARAIGMSLLATVGTAVFATAGADSRAEWLEWVENDREVTRKMLSFATESGLHDGGQWVPELAERHDVVSSGARELGFGGRLHHFRWPGGHLSAEAEVFAHDGRVVAYELTVGIEKQRAVLDAVEKVWEESGPDGVVRDRDSLTFQRRFPEAESARRDALAAALGVQGELDAPRKIRKKVAEQRSAFGQVVVGALCGFAPPREPPRTVFDELEDDRRVDLLAAILRGDQPESRVLAVAHLRRLQKNGTTLPPELVAAMDVVLDLPLPIETCSGCIIDSQGARDALAHYERSKGWHEVADESGERRHEKRRGMRRR